MTGAMFHMLQPSIPHVGGEPAHLCGSKRSKQQMQRPVPHGHVLARGDDAVETDQVGLQVSPWVPGGSTENMWLPGCQVVNVEL